MKYPQRLLISVPNETVGALAQIADEFTRAGYIADERRIVQDLLEQLFQRPDMLADLIRMVAEREEIPFQQFVKK